MIRSRKYLDRAKGQPCMVKIFGICNNDPTTTVMAHSNKYIHGKALGLKAHDFFCTLSCSNCHSVIDGHTRTEYTKAEIDEFWQRGFERTLLLAFNEGWIRFT